VNLEEYTLIAVSTRNPALLTYGQKMSMMALGLVCEATEIYSSEESLLGELGDVLWYLVNITDIVGILPTAYQLEPAPWRATYTGESALLELCSACGKVGDAVKKELGHGHDFMLGDFFALLQRALAKILMVADYHDLSLEDLMVYNAQKLAAEGGRYHGGFTTEKSVNREHT